MYKWCRYQSIRVRGCGSVQMGENSLCSLVSCEESSGCSSSVVIFCVMICSCSGAAKRHMGSHKMEVLL